MPLQHLEIFEVSSVISWKLPKVYLMGWKKTVGLARAVSHRRSWTNLSKLKINFDRRFHQIFSSVPFAINCSCCMVKLTTYTRYSFLSCVPQATKQLGFKIEQFCERCLDVNADSYQIFLFLIFWLCYLYGHAKLPIATYPNNSPSKIPCYHFPLTLEIANSFFGSSRKLLENICLMGKA